MVVLPLPSAIALLAITLFANPGSVATSTWYVSAAGLVFAALMIVSEMGCAVNLYVAPLTGCDANGPEKLTDGVAGFFEHADDSARAATATHTRDCHGFMLLVSLELCVTPARGVDECAQS